MNWNSVYDAFPVNREMIWLNNCGTTPAGSHVLEAVSTYMNGYSRKGVLTGAARYPDVNRRIKEILGELLNADPAELCLIHHTSEGMNFISHGLALEAGDEIILLENEYPSNIYPWRHWKEKGVILKTAPLGDDPEHFFQGLKTMMGERTKAVAVSAVHWCTGMPLPLERIGALCREKDIRFVVDGAQGVGLVPMDVRKMHIDFMAFSAWKWLMGPLGLGVLYIAKERLDSLPPIFVGTGSVVRDEEYLPYKSELKPDAERFNISTPSFMDWVYFLASLDFLKRIGFETVRERIYELTEHLNRRLRMTGYDVLSDRFSGTPTGMTVCRKADVDAGKLVSRLREQKIIAAERLGHVRLSPHVYLSEHQLEAAVRGISQSSLSQMYARSVGKSGS